MFLKYVLTLKINNEQITIKTLNFYTAKPQPTNSVCKPSKKFGKVNPLEDSF